MQVLLNDPPRHIGVSLDEIAQTCDIITFHTPLTRSGDYPPYHLCDEAFLRRCRPDTLIINAARGGVVDEAALLAVGQPCVIDTWENEPRLNRELLQAIRYKENTTLRRPASTLLGNNLGCRLCRLIKKSYLCNKNTAIVSRVGSPACRICSKRTPTNLSNYANNID